MDAIQHSGLEITEENGHRIGIAMGSGIGGIKFIQDNHVKMLAGGVRKVSPFFIPGCIINMTSGQVSILQRRTWRKLHLAIDESTHELLMSVISTNDVKDSEVFEDLIEPIEEEIEQVSADGAYDTFKIHDYLKQKEIQAVIPPQKNAKIKHPQMETSPLLRDQYIREIQQTSRKEWKVKHKYHRRSLSETACTISWWMASCRLWCRRQAATRFSTARISSSWTPRGESGRFMTALIRPSAPGFL